MSKPNGMRRGGCRFEECTGKGKLLCTRCNRLYCKKHFVLSKKLCKTCQSRVRHQAIR